MRLVVALGGNALLQRGEAPSAANQATHVRQAAAQVARLAAGNELLLTHGNGPQVGLLALQSAAYAALPGGVESYPLDVLGAESEGMLGYLLEQELANLLPAQQAVVSLLTRVEVDPRDPAFQRPSKPIGPVYSAAQATKLAASRRWVMGPDGAGFRRLVASPKPLAVPSLPTLRWLLAQGALVIAAGGGGIPVARWPAGRGPAGEPGLHGLHGVEAVIDKDRCSALIAIELQADCLLIATDVDAVYLHWGEPGQRALHQTTPGELEALPLAAGSMGPKVEAACAFVKATGRRAVIGALGQIEAMLAGSAGTQIVSERIALSR